MLAISMLSAKRFRLVLIRELEIPKRNLYRSAAFQIFARFCRFNPCVTACHDQAAQFASPWNHAWE
jgi:hypothetical protein